MTLAQRCVEMRRMMRELEEACEAAETDINRRLDESKARLERKLADHHQSLLKQAAQVLSPTPCMSEGAEGQLLLSAQQPKVFKSGVVGAS